MFHLDEGAPGPRVYLRPKESIHIPLKYQSFLCDHTMALQVQLKPEVDADATVRNRQLILYEHHILEIIIIAGTSIFDKLDCTLAFRCYAWALEKISFAFRNCHHKIKVTLSF